MKNQNEMNIRIPQYATAKNWRDIPTAGFNHMELVSHGDDPAMTFMTETEEWVFPLNNGFQIHVCNEFLRTVTVGVEIHFDSFTQYGKLIDACNEKLNGHTKRPIFDYSDLKMRIAQKLGMELADLAIDALAAALDTTADDLKNKLELNVEFDLDDIRKIADMLEIDPSVINRYFFKEVTQ